MRLMPTRADAGWIPDFRAVVWRGREKLHYLNPVPIHEIFERWIGKYERHRLQALGDLKRGLEENKTNKKG